MAPLSKFTLTSCQRTHPNRDPIEERRSKTLAALEQQKMVLTLSFITQVHDQRQKTKTKLCGQGGILLLNRASVKIPHTLLSIIANPTKMLNTVSPLMHTVSTRLCIIKPEDISLTKIAATLPRC